MSSAAASGFTFLVTFVFLALLAVMWSIRGGAQDDLVTGFSCQLIAYTLGLFAILRVYAPERGIREFLALRPTAWVLYPLAILLGIVVTFPADAAYDFICARYPTAEPDHLTATFQAAAPARRVVMGFILAAAGPAVEEMFFRGALFRPLKRQMSPLFAAALTAILFSVVHLEWQMFAPIMVLGLCLGLLRAWSGSLVVSTLVHAAFNAVSLGNLVRESRGASPLRVPVAVTAGAAVVAVVIMFVAYYVANRSDAGAAAREADA